MAGSSSNELRSAYVAEATAGTMPATPSFTTSDVPILINATSNVSESRTQHALGARSDTSVQGREVAGAMSGQLIYGNYDVFLETLLQGSWSSNVLKDGKAVSTVSVENAIAAGAGGTNTMMRYRGVEAVGGTISANSEEPINFNFDLMGRASDAASTTAITGATYTDPTNVAPLVSGLDVGTIVIDGYTLDCMSSVEIEFAYEDRNRQTKIGSYDLCGITRGALAPVINARMYIEGNFAAIFDAARQNHSAFSVTIPLGNVSGSKYNIEFPSCKFGSGTLDFGSADAMMDVVIHPIYDTTEDCVCKITRAVS